MTEKASKRGLLVTISTRHTHFTRIFFLYSKDAVAALPGPGAIVAAT